MCAVSFGVGQLTQIYPHCYVLDEHVAGDILRSRCDEIEAVPKLRGESVN